MPLESGTRLGHYEIAAQIGKGGMGEVYRARDTKLGREVAIKVLPSELSRDEERLARLEREARMLAALNHPNVAAIHGLEQSEDTRFLVLELVEGETLAERLQRGAIPVEESLKLALQIAEALEAAHEKGVIHRDLKPANIKITPEGRVKVLDFGLAKAFIGDKADVNLSHSPTLSMAATQAGIILGTAAYMSPEQASGEVADHRADVWAFGVVLFEMMTGRQLFTGKTAAHVMGAVLNIEPDWNTLPSHLHPRVRVLLERLLEKESKDRLSGISDARVEIQRVLAGPEGPYVRVAAGVVRTTPQSRLLWIAGILLGLVASGSIGWFARPVPPVQVTRFSHVLPEDQVFTNTGRPVVAVSPDGSRLVYVANQQLWMRAMDTLESNPIPGTEETPTAPFFSPDGLWIGYWSGADGQLKKIAVSGGAPITLTEAANPYGQPHWSPDDVIVWGQSTGIMTVSGNGGVAEALIEPFGEGELNRPQFLPGGGAVLFDVGNANAAEIWVQSLESGDRRRLLTGTAPRYVPTGHIVYDLNGVLFAVPFDLDSLELTGGPVSLVEGIQSPSQYAVSEMGTLAYVGGGGGGSDLSLGLANRQGGIDQLDVPPARYLHPRLSPDGTRIVVQTIEDDGQDVIWIYDLSGQRAIRQLTQQGNSIRPIWTPDSQRVTFASDRDGSNGIYWQLADGSSVAERLTTAEEGNEHWPESWSPDGKTLSFAASMEDDWSIWTLSLEDGEVSTQPFFDLPGSAERGSVFSPDGAWLAYHSNAGGVFELYVQPFPPTGVTYPVTQTGGTWPLWSPDGGELVYRRNGLESVDVSTQPSFSFGNARPLNLSGFFTNESYRHFDIASDGETFLVRTLPSAVGDSPSPHINVVLNWFEELKERVPVP